MPLQKNPGTGTFTVPGSGRSVAWLARLFRVQEVVSSNLTAPTILIFVERRALKRGAVPLGHEPNWRSDAPFPLTSPPQGEGAPARALERKAWSVRIRSIIYA